MRRIVTLLRTAAFVACAAVCICGMPGVAAAAPVVDQSFTGPENGQAAIGQCCAYIGQTFTAGRTGILAGVSVQVGAAFGVTNPLDVQIRTVDSSGLPTATILGEALTSSSSFLDQLIPFPQAIPSVAGTQYAIVVHYQGGGSGGWDGNVDNPYPPGQAVMSFDNGVTWSAISSSGPSMDLEFQTYVDALPTSMAECKNGGWQSFGGMFKNQGDCVSFVVTGGKNPPSGS